MNKGFRICYTGEKLAEVEFGEAIAFVLARNLVKNSWAKDRGGMCWSQGGVVRVEGNKCRCDAAMVRCRMIPVLGVSRVKMLEMNGYRVFERTGSGKVVDASGSSSGRRFFFFFFLRIDRMRVGIQ